MFDFLFNPAFANDNDALVPELWAEESLAILEETMVTGKLVHRDFENEIARFGDVVNTRRPGNFVMRRKVDTEDVTTQDASLTNVQVPLNQWGHVSFMIYDGEESKSMKDLVNIHLRPQAIAVARGVDRVINGRVAQVAMVNRVGNLGTAADHNLLIKAGELFDNNLAPADADRHMIITSATKSHLLQQDKYSDADRVGDNGTALRTASLGQKAGFNLFMTQDASKSTSSTGATTATTTSAAAVVGDSVINVTSATGLNVGMFMLVAGRPYRITAINTLAISVTPTVDVAIASGAVVIAYASSLVNQASTALADGGDGASADGYRVGWHKAIILDTVAAPEVGSIVAFGAGTAMYTVIHRDSSTSITLDRPLDAAIANNDRCSRIGPGNFNLALHRNAFALVTRPLALPRAGTGAMSAIATYNGFGFRVVITYDGKAQGHRVTGDLLFGVANLDTALAAMVMA